MKIKIKGNSLRYRLTRSDVCKLQQAQYLEERTTFIGDTLIYAVTITTNMHLSAEFRDMKIMLHLPKVMLEAFGEAGTIGFGDEKGPVILLIEKDFTCLDNIAEDQSDNFPNPAFYVD